MPLRARVATFRIPDSKLSHQAHISGNPVYCISGNATENANKGLSHPGNRLEALCWYQRNQCINLVVLPLRARAMDHVISDNRLRSHAHIGGFSISDCRPCRWECRQRFTVSLIWGCEHEFKQAGSVYWDGKSAIESADVDFHHLNIRRRTVCSYQQILWIKNETMPLRA
jgi:hypothetical protein